MTGAASFSPALLAESEAVADWERRSEKSERPEAAFETEETDCPLVPDETDDPAPEPVVPLP